MGGIINIGKSIVEGIWSGISSMIGWITDKVTGFFSGIVNGVGNGKFNPEGTITRQEAAAMVARAAKLCGLDKKFLRFARKVGFLSFCRLLGSRGT